MSYNPYANTEDVETTQTNRLHQPQPQRSFPQQPQHQQQFQPGLNQYQQNQQNQQPTNPQFFTQTGTAANTMNPNIFNDPTAAFTLQAGQHAMMAGSQFMEQNFAKYVPTGTFKYYFKVSNSYVLSKLMLILFPFKNKNWTRMYRTSDPAVTQGQVDPNAEMYEFPLGDKNAPDYYIPLMGAITYNLLLALLAGLNDEFHPEVFGFEASSTIAYLLLDFIVLKGGLYILGIGSNAYDLIAYIGYKFVPIIIVLLVKNLTILNYLKWAVYLYLIVAYGFFELRAIRFNLFGGINNSIQTMSSKSLKNSNYFLFFYAFAFQGGLLWLLS